MDTSYPADGVLLNIILLDRFTCIRTIKKIKRQPIRCYSRYIKCDTILEDDKISEVTGYFVEMEPFYSSILTHIHKFIVNMCWHNGVVISREPHPPKPKTLRTNEHIKTTNNPPPPY